VGAVFTLGMAIVARRAHLTLVDHLQVTARLAVSEEAAKRAEGVMREARDLAERVARARSAFLANMSHEIRTPMNAVLGFVELILDTELTPEQLGSVFREFTQADSTMTRRYGGTGLGLAISQRLVRLMGGEITVTSEVGRGSEFSFTLPFPAEVAAPRAAGLATLGGRRMLIVDDNQTNRRILRDMLATEGIKVDEASTAGEGLEAIRGAAKMHAPYHLAILDVQMPDMDGVQLATAVRAAPGLSRPRLLLL